MTMFGESGTGPALPGFLGSFLKALAFVTLCGIVGPIFLIAYFLIDEPGLEWMLWTGLGVTALDVGLAFLIARAGAARRAGSARLRTGGRMAIADITGIEQTGVQINDQPLMKLSLHIHGDGVSPFDSQKRTVVPIFQQAMLHRRKLAVVVDPMTNDYEIDWQATALLTGSVPAQFTSSEDGRIYDLTGQAEPLIKVLEVARHYDVSATGSIDLRSNPHARQAVMDIVREYAGGSAARTAGTGSSTPTSDDPGRDESVSSSTRTPGERLADLEELRIQGAINDQEYAAARQRILDSI